MLHSLVMITDIMTLQDNTKAKSMTIYFLTVPYCTQFIRSHMRGTILLSIIYILLFESAWSYFSQMFLNKNCFNSLSQTTDLLYSYASFILLYLHILSSHVTNFNSNQSKVGLLIYICSHVISSKNVQSASH